MSDVNFLLEQRVRIAVFSHDEAVSLQNTLFSLGCGFSCHPKLDASLTERENLIGIGVSPFGVMVPFSIDRQTDVDIFYNDHAPFLLARDVISALLH